MAKVYITAAQTRNLRRLIEESKLLEGISSGDEVAIKPHMGESGNVTHVRPVFIREIVNMVKAIGAKPLVTDTTVIYGARRFTGLGHLEVASRNGFSADTMGCPIIIADGLDGNDGVSTRINGNSLKEVEIASAIYDVDALIVVSHATGHGAAGYGGAIKNLAMGCVTKRSKAQQHKVLMPKVDEELCNACGECAEVCPQDAITVEEIAIIDDEICTGCEDCLGACEYDALLRQTQNIPEFQKRLSDSAEAVLSRFTEGKVRFINFLTDITPHCDCVGHSRTPFVPDIGILASFDPLAIDQMSLDLINSEKNLLEVTGISYENQLIYAEKLGMGEREYESIRVR